jgi:hypothetical protein
MPMLALRVVCIGLGLGAALWGAITLPRFLDDRRLERVGFQIAVGEPFASATLAKVLSETAGKEEACRAAPMRARVMVALRLAESAIAAGERREIDSSLQRLNSLARSAISCAPKESFFWLSLYWVENMQNGYSPKNIELLRMSYRMGPNEGWVALLRNRMALGSFAALPADLAKAAIDEFAKLLDAGFRFDALSILVGPGWPVRQQLLDGIRNVALAEREALARMLSQRGYDLEVPGVLRADRHTQRN